MELNATHATKSALSCENYKILKYFSSCKHSKNGVEEEAITLCTESNCKHKLNNGNINCMHWKKQANYPTHTHRHTLTHPRTHKCINCAMLSLLSLLATAAKKEKWSKVNGKVKEKQCGKTQRRLQCKLAWTCLKFGAFFCFSISYIFPLCQLSFLLLLLLVLLLLAKMISWILAYDGVRKDLRSLLLRLQAMLLPSNLCKHFASNMIKLIVKTRTGGQGGITQEKQQKQSGQGRRSDFRCSLYSLHLCVRLYVCVSDKIVFSTCGQCKGCV